MERLAFVHVGLPKTGTTAIQQFMSSARGPLQRAGYTYPGREEDHAVLAAAFHPLGARHYYFVRRKLADPGAAAEKLLAECGSAEGRLVLSSEYLHNIGEAGARRLNDRLGALGFTVRVVCYVRHPVDAAVSSAQQSIKMGDRSLAEAITAPRYTRIKPNVLPLIRALGAENVVVRNYAAARTAGLVHDFTTVIGCPDLIGQVQPPGTTNESISMDAALLADMHRSHEMEHGKRLFPKSLIFRIGGDRFDLPVETKEIVRRAGAEDLDWLRKTCGLELEEATSPNRYRAHLEPQAVTKLLQMMADPRA